MNPDPLMRWKEIVILDKGTHVEAYGREHSYTDMRSHSNVCEQATATGIRYQDDPQVRLIGTNINFKGMVAWLSDRNNDRRTK